MGDAEKASQVLAELKALDVRLSIDDFGTGFEDGNLLVRLRTFGDDVEIERVRHCDDQFHDLLAVWIVIHRGRTDRPSGYRLGAPEDGSTMSNRCPRPVTRAFSAASRTRGRSAG